MAYPLVSVVVITYNSSKTILETLESMKIQTYSRVELIVSDDGSKDDTVTICRDWIEQNKIYFEGVELVTVEKNVGTCANLNRGVNASHGVWLKPIAGDDTLCDNAIEEYVKFVTEQNCEFCYARMNYIGEGEFLKGTIDFYDGFCVPNMRKPLKEQQKLIQEVLFIPGPGIFISRSLLDNIGGYDEKYMFADEWPQFYRIINGGTPIKVLEKRLVNYRVSVGSLCHEKNDIGTSMNRFVFKSMKSFFDDVVFVDSLRKGNFLIALNSKIQYHIMAVGIKYSVFSIRYKLTCCLKYFSPLFCLRKLGLCKVGV